MSAAENLQPFHKVISWSQFNGAKDNQPDRHNGTWDQLREILTTVQKKPRHRDLAEAKKHVPAFSGSTFYEGRTRSQENTESIHLLVFDFDNTIEEPIPGEYHASGRPKTRKIPVAKPASPDAVVATLEAAGYDAVVYTTWSHKPELAKFRVVLPLQAPISPAYWTQATEWAMEHLGFEDFRDSRAIDIPVLRDVARLNFLPCAPERDSVQTWTIQGRHLSIPEQALPTLHVRELPRPEWQKPRPAVDERTGREWWRGFRIDWKTLNLEGLMRAMGVQIGAAQPWNGGFKWRCHCPWAVEHTHGLDDDCAVIIQTHGDWPSFKCAHSHHAHLGLREVCEAAGKPLVQSYGKLWEPKPSTVTAGAEPEDEEEGLPPGPEHDDQRSVWDRLHKTEKGYPSRVPANLAKILRHDPHWGSRLSLDEMSREILHDGETLGEYSVDHVQEWVQDNYEMNFGRDEVRAKLLAQAAANTVHPVREYLKALPAWDGEERLAKVAERVLSAEPNPMHTQYLTRWAVGAVRRVMQPGVKLDTALVLVGPQGYLKSTFFQVLSDPWFGDSPISLQDKDGYMVLHRRWITEFGEIDHTTTVQSQERVKAFLSSREDIFRPPFAASVGCFKRSCVIAGTTNREGFLTDPSGSRRFWPIKVGAQVNVDLLASWRDQLWAEAVTLEHAGVPHWLDTGMDTLRESQSVQFTAEDPWIYELGLALDVFRKAGRMFSDGFPLAELLAQMGIPSAQRTKGASMKLAELLRSLGWTDALAGPKRLKRWFPPEES